MRDSPSTIDLVDFLDQLPKSYFNMLIVMLWETLELEQECKASVYCLQLLRQVIVGQSAVQYSPALSGIPDRGFTPIRHASPAVAGGAASGESRSTKLKWLAIRWNGSKHGLDEVAFPRA
jgi:hypothetical protein